MAQRGMVHGNSVQATLNQTGTEAISFAGVAAISSLMPRAVGRVGGLLFCALLAALSIAGLPHHNNEESASPKPKYKWNEDHDQSTRSPRRHTYSHSHLFPG